MSEKIALTDTRHGSVRAEAFLRSWQHMPVNTYADFRIGRTTAGEAALAITIGSEQHAFTAREARVVADIIKEAVEKFPAQSRDEGFAEMRAAILAAVEVAEAAL